LSDKKIKEFFEVWNEKIAMHMVASVLK